ncbi:MAG: ATP-binding cassette domain-containing protein, partial [Bacillota bacterium]
RRNEFAAVLGQSGCGKTTLLNIIGGLDGYTDGDLFINRKSTKEFVDGDWDSYRNSSVGFVFQSYNLIMHQTVLQNVELALTLVGLPKAERLQKALSALDKVGLLDQRNKKPNQMSGGQMQRVAIARAIVNDPEILLADEPTGALDTESSVQIMDILKEVAKDRLVIMVTHNPDLAEQYANRIIKLRDGNVDSDSNPFCDEGEFVVMPKKKVRRQKIRRTFVEFFTSRFGGVAKEKGSCKQQENEVISNEEYKEIEASKADSKKTAMRWSNALKLSFSNLITKKMRTTLTAVAGSIGIIGIALVLALSTGVSTYLASVEENSLSSYPIEINQSSFNMDSLLDLLSDNGIEYESYPDSDEIYVDGLLSNLLANVGDLADMVTENDIISFKSYLEDSFDTNDGYYSYVYDVDMRIYSELSSGEYMKVNPINFDGSGLDISSMFSDDVFEGLLDMDFWGEMSNDQSLLESQYDIIGGSWPTESNEIVIVVDEENKIDDFCLFALGLLEPSDVLGVILGQKEIPEITIDTLLGLEYTLMANTDFYTCNEETGLYDYSLASSEDNKDASIISTSGTTLEVAGVVRAKEGISATAITGIVAYSSDLVVDTINRIIESDVVAEQIASPSINVVTGEEIADTTAYETALAALGIVDIDDPEGILLYASSFDGKDNIISLIETYNLSADVAGTDKEISYVDSLTVMMSYISSLTNTITAVLIGFSAISLIVSSIMISIITYTSVLERTKEIGVLRSLGARKRDISRVFNAETTMIGFMSGTIGVLITALLCIPTNIILNNQFGISGLATLEIFPALFLVAISVIISNIAGFLPARMAASCDPVKALRTE